MSDRHMDAKVLRRAGELVEQGWCRFYLAMTGTGICFEGPTSPKAVQWCARGAIQRAAHELDVADESDRVEDLAGENYGGAFGLAHWNNDPERTADEVAAALREAADRVEAAL